MDVIISMVCSVNGRFPRANIVRPYRDTGVFTPLSDKAAASEEIDKCWW